MPKQNRDNIQIRSLRELYQCEEEILERIEKMPNGGYLFTLHPLMLLKDVGVDLSKQATEELLKLEPQIKAYSQRAYTCVRNSKVKQNIHVRLKKLFRREE